MKKSIWAESKVARDATLLRSSRGNDQRPSDLLREIEITGISTRYITPVACFGAKYIGGDVEARLRFGGEA
jgi:hypothetical protein